MRKKILLFTMVLVLSASAIFAGDFRYVFNTLDQHVEVLGGFLPTYTVMGAGYSFPFIEGNTTEVQLLLGGGYTQRKLWQDPLTGREITRDPLVYDAGRADWTLNFTQGFLTDPLDGSDMLRIRVSYDGRFNYPLDSMVVGKGRDYNTDKGAVRTIDGWFASNGASRAAQNVYPDLNDRYTVSSLFSAQFSFNIMEDLTYEQNGVDLKVRATWAPGFMNRAADFISLDFNTVGAWTPLQIDSAGRKKNAFSITFVDRFNMGYTTGKKVPSFYSGEISLGRKVRGFTTWSYDTEFTIVNNFDIRLTGLAPFDVNIAPRINLFFDMGWHTGNLFNSAVEKTDFLCSTGAQLTVTFFDMFDLGLQTTYLIAGDNYNAGIGENFVTSATFFLDF